MVITGASSAICQELTRLSPEPVVVVGQEQVDMRDLAQITGMKSMLQEHNRIVVAHGSCSDVPFLSRQPADIAESLFVNCVSEARLCEIALAANPSARICVIGSASAIKGSWDIPYWFGKAGLHSYVRERRLEHPGQQLVCVAPSGIDCGMTLRRPEREIAELRQSHPKRRLVSPAEVAKLVHFLLFVDEGYITNTVIEINGGRFARRG